MPQPSSSILSYTFC